MSDGGEDDASWCSSSEDEFFDPEEEIRCENTRDLPCCWFAIPRTRKNEHPFVSEVTSVHLPLSPSLSLTHTYAALSLSCFQVRAAEPVVADAHHVGGVLVTP
jgi:hypothetical protein